MKNNNVRDFKYTQNNYYISYFTFTLYVLVLTTRPIDVMIF